jgi:arsenite methyltransferase
MESVNLMSIEYLNKSFDWRLPEIAEYIDEVSLWSAPFGLMLLDKIPLKPDMKVLDVGFGTGFPLIEIAQRLGSSSTVYGIDTWIAASDRAKRKLKAYKVENVEIAEGDASQLPYDTSFLDMVTANLLINNLEEPDKVISEIFRVLKPGGSFHTATNVVGHMREFYKVFRNTLAELKMDSCLPALAANIKHRLDAGIITDKLRKTGFKKIKSYKNSFIMRFLNGSAFLNHSFIILGFMDGWKAVIPDKDKLKFFTRLEQNLNSYAEEKGELKLTIPMVYIEAEK